MNKNKRDVLKGLAVGSAWVAPVVSCAVLPAHADTSPACENLAEGKEGFSFTGGEQTFTVPAGVCSIEVTLNGAGGGGGENFLGLAGVGGAGEEVTDIIDVTPGETLTIIVGGGGGRGLDSGTALGGYGGGAEGDGSPATTNDTGPFSGGGGGASSIKRGSTLLIASGGGGGGSDSGSIGGDGGGPNGGSGGNGDNAAGDPAGNGLGASGGAVDTDGSNGTVSIIW